MNHRSGPPIDSDPDLAAIAAELVTERVPNPPRGYAVVVARWLYKHGYRAGQGAVAAYEATERYLADECGLSPEFVRCYRRRSIAQVLTAKRTGTVIWRVDCMTLAVAVGDTEVNALARAIERLVRAGFRVGMDQMTTARLLDAATFKDLRNEAEPEDAPWIADLEAKRAQAARATAT